MEMYQVQVYDPDSREIIVERIVFAGSEDEAISFVQEELKNRQIPYGICMAQTLRSCEAGGSFMESASSGERKL